MRLIDKLFVVDYAIESSSCLKVPRIFDNAHHQKSEKENWEASMLKMKQLIKDKEEEEA